MFEKLNIFKKDNRSEILKYDNAYIKELSSYSKNRELLSQLENNINYLSESKTNNDVDDLEIDDKLKILNFKKEQLIKDLENSPLNHTEELEKINEDIKEVANKLEESTVEFYELNAQFNNREKKYLNIKLSSAEQTADKAEYDKLVEAVTTMRIVRNSYENTLNDLKAKHEALFNKLKEACYLKTESKEQAIKKVA